MKKREKLTDNFYRDEFACKCGCLQADIDKKIVSLLQDVRDEYGFPLKVTSAVRCFSWNVEIGGSPTSSHLEGLACDIFCEDVHLRYRLLPILFSRFKRIGVYQNFFHVDIDHKKANPVCW
jgi:uncharacterized protein YcbK (DUF882 family)